MLARPLSQKSWFAPNNLMIGWLRATLTFASWPSQKAYQEVRVGTFIFQVQTVLLLRSARHLRSLQGLKAAMEGTGR